MKMLNYTLTCFLPGIFSIHLNCSDSSLAEVSPEYAQYHDSLEHVYDSSNVYDVNVTGLAFGRTELGLEVRYNDTSSGKERTVLWSTFPIVVIREATRVTLVFQIVLGELD